MIRDPFYRQVIERLGAPLDPELFERCAQDLLRQVYPALVPIRGGSDAGMDGAIADGLGSAFPLVCTSAKRVLRNLRQSLNRYIKEGGTRRRVVCATSQALTRRRRQNLESEAQRQEFELVQIHDRAAMADLLYGSPKWCKELLNLTGNPPALSIRPVSTRPLIGECLVGREEEAQWLTSTQGDRLLLGQPGSGKTFLLYQLAKENGWLFVTDSDRGRIAEGVRSQSPSALIVDDAHGCPGLLRELRHLREEIGPDIPLIAASWPGARDEITELLSLSNDRVRELRPLTRPQIQEVLEKAGLTGPDQLIREILNQAEGRPGLAATLAYFCLAGDVRDVVLGDALVRSVGVSFGELIGATAVEMLAAFALGGRAGMSMQAVADGFKRPPADIRRDTNSLAAGGVILEVDGARLAVRPRELGHALVRDVFFSGATALDLEPFLSGIAFVEEVALTVIGACRIGAQVSPQLLRSLVESADSVPVWQSYAWLGPDELQFALDRNPDLLDSLIQPALHHIPELAICRLMESAIGDNRPPHSHPEQPLRVIKDWIKRALPGSGEPLRRRRALFQAAREWLESGRDAPVGVAALCESLYPGFEHHSTDPVLGRSVTFTRGLLTAEELDCVAGLWHEVRPILGAVECQEWRSVLNAVENWVYPQRLVLRSIADESRDTIRRNAEVMVRDLVAMAKGCPGALQRIGRYAEDLGLSLELESDATFELLFPPFRGSWKEDSEELGAEIRRIAAEWAPLEPREIVERIARYEGEAASIGERGGQSHCLCDEIAANTTQPLEWVRAIVAVPATGHLVAPFLSRAASLQELGWEEVAVECVEREPTRAPAVSVILTLAAPPEAVLSVTLRSLNGLVGHVKFLCMGNRVPVPTLERLLDHTDKSVAAQTAIGIWVADPKGEVPERLRERWRKGIAHCASNEHWLGEIFEKDPTLASEWLAEQLGNRDSHFYSEDRATETACRVLSTAQRSRLLEVIPRDSWPYEVVAKLIGNDIDLYRQVLAEERLKRLHLAPLITRPDESGWVEKAKVALECGYGIDEVAQAVFQGVQGWCGEESDMWKSWEKAFDAIASDPDERIRQVAESGSAYVNACYESALQRERLEQTFDRP